MARGQAVCRTLHIDPLNKSTCVGLNKRGTLCGCLVARASRERAYSVLGSGAGLCSDSRELRKIFREAAGLLLCKRWHQDQWRSIVDSWLSRWEEAEETDRDSGYGSNVEGSHRSSSELRVIDQSDEDEYPSPPRTPRQQSTSVERRQSSEHQITANWQAAYESLLSSVLNSNLSSDARVAILQTALASPSSPSTRSSPTTRQVQNQPRSTATTPTQQSSRQSSPRSPTTSPSPRSPSSPIAPAMTRRQSTPETTQNTARPTPTPESPETDSPPTAIDPLRHSHIECPICMSSYSDGEDEEFFECSACLNRTHLSCHRQWASSDPRTTTCTFCRAIVPPLL